MYICTSIFARVLPSRRNYTAHSRGSAEPDYRLTFYRRRGKPGCNYIYIYVSLYVYRIDRMYIFIYIYMYIFAYISNCAIPEKRHLWQARVLYMLCIRHLLYKCISRFLIFVFGFGMAMVTSAIIPIVFNIITPTSLKTIIPMVFKIIIPMILVFRAHKIRNCDSDGFCVPDHYSLVFIAFV